MRLRKFGHACVRLEDGDRVLVIDPGTFTEPEALAGATAVLVTHEHPDHIDKDRLDAARAADPALTVHTHPGFAAEIGATGVGVGENFTVAGFAVTVVGGEHAEIIDGRPGCANVGFVVDGVYHPGDALFVPELPIETVLVPACAPWLKHREAIEFLRAIRPARAFPIHDAGLSQIGMNNFDDWMEEEKWLDYARLPAGQSVDLG